MSLDRQHAQRRGLVWGELGEAPLACTLQHLATLASVTGSSLAAGSLDDLGAAYANQGWRADQAVMRALEYASSNPGYEAITVAARAVYLPWVEDAARHLQKIVSQVTPPGGTREGDPPPYVCKDQCVLFVDGLRFDTAKRLTELLDSAGFEVEEEPTWTALPSVTATGKAAVSPVRDQITGAPGSTDFESNVRESGVRLSNYHLRKLLGQAGWEVLKGHETGAGQGRAWCEFGDIDHEGHSRGWKLAMHLDGMLGEIRERIDELLAAGWAEVRVVTDHGWLLMSGGLPKIEPPPAYVSQTNASLHSSITPRSPSL